MRWGFKTKTEELDAIYPTKWRKHFAISPVAIGTWPTIEGWVWWEEVEARWKTSTRLEYRIPQ